MKAHIRAQAVQQGVNATQDLTAGTSNSLSCRGTKHTRLSSCSRFVTQLKFYTDFFSGFSTLGIVPWFLLFAVPHRGVADPHCSHSSTWGLKD